jgi:hypothetical protein
MSELSQLPSFSDLLKIHVSRDSLIGGDTRYTVLWISDPHGSSEREISKRI